MKIYFSLVFAILPLTAAESSFESQCMAPTSVYKWDTCFTISLYNLYDVVVDSCNAMTNGRLATGLSTEQIVQILDSIYDKNLATHNHYWVSINDRPLQAGDTVKIVGRFPPDIETYEIDFFYYDNGVVTAPLVLQIDIAGTINPADSLTCTQVNVPGAVTEQALDIGLPAGSEFTFEIVIQASSYEIYLDGSFLRTCTEVHPIGTAVYINTWGVYTSSIGSVVDSVTRGSHFYGGESFLWLNLIREHNTWVWKSDKSSIQALSSNVQWETNQPDNLVGNENCAVVNANSGEIRDTRCDARAPALCMYEPNYKKFKYSKSAGKMGNGGQLGSVIKGAVNEILCLTKCNEFAVCRGVDYNSNTKTCHLYDGNNSTDVSGYEFYEKI